jgi:hypothetical protein
VDSDVLTKGDIILVSVMAGGVLAIIFILNISLSGWNEYLWRKAVRRSIYKNLSENKKKLHDSGKKSIDKK